MIWSQQPDDYEQKMIEFYDNFPMTVCFIDGNHENHDRLDNDFPEIDFHGGRAHKISDNIYHLMRGYMFDFGGKKFFAFGGASSHDIRDGVLDPEAEDFSVIYNILSSKPLAQFRIKGISWWEREMPSADEMIRGLDNLEKVNYKVDFVLTHSLPTTAITTIFKWRHFTPDKLNEYFDELVKNGFEFEHWYSGHYHEDYTFWEKYTMMYDKIERVV